MQVSRGMTLERSNLEVKLNPQIQKMERKYKYSDSPESIQWPFAAKKIDLQIPGELKIDRIIDRQITRQTTVEQLRRFPELKGATIHDYRGALLFDTCPLWSLFGLRFEFEGWDRYQVTIHTKRPPGAHSRQDLPKFMPCLAPFFNWEELDKFRAEYRRCWDITARSSTMKDRVCLAMDFVSKAEPWITPEDFHLFQDKSDVDAFFEAVSACRDYTGSLTRLKICDIRNLLNEASMVLLNAANRRNRDRHDAIN